MVWPYWVMGVHWDFNDGLADVDYGLVEHYTCLTADMKLSFAMLVYAIPFTGVLDETRDNSRLKLVVSCKSNTFLSSTVERLRNASHTQSREGCFNSEGACSSSSAAGEIDALSHSLIPLDESLI